MLRRQDQVSLEKPARAVADHIKRSVDKTISEGAIEKFLEEEHKDGEIPGLDAITYGQFREAYNEASTETGAIDPIRIYEILESISSSRADQAKRDCPVDTGFYVPINGVPKEAIRRIMSDEVKRQVKTIEIVDEKLKIPEAIARSLVKASGKVPNYAIAGVSAAASGTTFFLARRFANERDNIAANLICGALTVPTFLLIEDKVSSMPNSSTIQEGSLKALATVGLFTSSILAQIAVRKGIGYFTSKKPAPAAVVDNEHRSLNHFYK